MTEEESSRLRNYILSVIDILSTDNIVEQVIDNNIITVGYIDSDDDESTSSLEIFNSLNDGLYISFDHALKVQLTNDGLDKDDYFNLSLEYDLILSFEDLKMVLNGFCNNKKFLNILIPYSVFYYIKQGKIDEPTNVFTI